MPTTGTAWSPRWKTLVRLHEHQPGRYLHQCTSGMIGSLSHLIRGAAIESILGGTEKITRRLLDSIDLDPAAEKDTPRAHPSAEPHAGPDRDHRRSPTSLTDPARPRH